MAKAPAFQFYAGDFLTDVMDWTDEEVGVHIRLIAWSWVNRRGIPRDTQRLTRIAPKVVEAWPVIKEKWSAGPDDTWVNEKLEGIRSDSDAFRASQRERSLLAVAARQGKPKPIGKPSGSPTGKPNGKPMGSPMGNPLEGEVEVSTEGRMEREKSVDMIWPGWAGPNTLSAWEEFKAYRLAEYKMRYKAKATEQKAVNRLAQYYKTGKDCVDGLNLAMARGWKFPVDPSELKPTQANGKPTEMTKAEADEALRRLRIEHGIPPGGMIETHLIPKDVLEAIRRP